MGLSYWFFECQGKNILIGYTKKKIGGKQDSHKSLILSEANPDILPPLIK